MRISKDQMTFAVVFFRMTQRQGRWKCHNAKARASESTIHGIRKGDPDGILRPD